ncbi:hypothetical protein CCB80_02225 [Armatimonadetes bacterium Uphvl-Ar1]|nr:hypothetical protein CCB80_02225 [Armatimonadetes bacterium Uphvl-Ar1]
MNQKPKVSRLKLAEYLSNSLNAEITATVIRDIEEERSAKWVNEYADWAKAHWSEATMPYFLEENSPTQLPSFSQVNNAPYLKLEPFNCEGFFESQPKSEQLAHWRCPIALSSGTSDYRAIIINGNKLAPLFPHGTVLLFQNMSTPPLDSIVISAYESELVIGLLTTDNRNFLLLAFSGEEVEVSRFRPYGALIGAFQNYRPVTGIPTGNISWNDEKTLVFFPDQLRGVIS